MTTNVLARPLARTAMLDAFLLLAVGAVPALSHLFSAPLYEFEPMRLSLFAAILFSGRRNSYVLAIGMPVFAAVATGHPMPPKMFLIQFELLANAWLFQKLLSGGRGFGLAAILSMVFAKTLYYGCKYVSVKLGWLGGPLVATAWAHQAAVAVLIAGGGHVIWRMRRDRSEPAAGSAGES